MKACSPLITLTMIVSLSACTILNPPIKNTSYPAPEQSMPLAEGNDQFSGIPYPQIDDGATIEPSVAEGLLRSGTVVRITTRTGGEAVFLLKDGRALVLIIPFEGAIPTWIERCGDPCKKIEIIQE